MCEYLEDAPVESFSSIGIFWKTSAMCPWNHLKCCVMQRLRLLPFLFTFSISFYSLFFPSHLNRLYSQTWSGVSRDMSDDQRLPVCGWFILNEKTLWSGLRAVSNAHHLQITMIKHSNGMDSYPQTSHSLIRLAPFKQISRYMSLFRTWCQSSDEQIGVKAAF